MDWGGEGPVDRNGDYYCVVGIIVVVVMERKEEEQLAVEEATVQ